MIAGPVERIADGAHDAEREQHRDRRREPPPEIDIATRRTPFRRRQARASRSAAPARKSSGERESVRAKKQRQRSEHRRRRHARLEQIHRPEHARAVHRERVQPVMQVQEIDRAVLQVRHDSLLARAGVNGTQRPANRTIRGWRCSTGPFRAAQLDGSPTPPTPGWRLRIWRPVRTAGSLPRASHRRSSLRRSCDCSPRRPLRRNADRGWDGRRRARATAS